MAFLLKLAGYNLLSYEFLVHALFAVDFLISKYVMVFFAYFHIWLLTNDFDTYKRIF